jgi:hypothetical protein
MVWNDYLSFAFSTYDLGLNTLQSRERHMAVNWPSFSPFPLQSEDRSRHEAAVVPSPSIAPPSVVACQSDDPVLHALFEPDQYLSDASLLAIEHQVFSLSHARVVELLKL